jgi:spermidine synthase
MTSMTMTMRISVLRRLALLLLSVVAFSRATDTTTTDTTAEDENFDLPRIVKLGNGVLQWVLEQGGWFHPSLHFAAPDGYMVMFSKEAIPKDETLWIVPRVCMLDSQDYDPYDSSIPDSDYVYICETARVLWRELQDGHGSVNYGPYIEYLLETQPPGVLPSAWSKAGQDLLEKMLSSQDNEQVLPPEEVFMHSYAGECDVEVDEADGDARVWGQEHAWMLMTQRSWDDVLIPVYDMLSHRNGNWTNTKLAEGASTHDEDNDIIVQASRDISAGEEIYTSYNFCEDCGNRAYFYGTSHIFRDYGFIEQYPQRWIFGEIVFDLDYKNGDPNELQVSWVFDPPDDDGTAFFEEQLDRLQEFATVHLETQPNDFPDWEWSNINIYHQALINAMSHALTATCSLGGERCSISHRYDSFLPKPDTLNYADYTCDRGANMAFPEYDHDKTINSPYHDMTFYEHPETKDTCFDVDTTVQMCGSFRPHYHEMFVHYAARYVDEVKRVLWVGGGDSMLLHEILKYPSLEFVVGLDLDQHVTRHSFKKFGTQPHWDNDKVQWWYGDAAESVMMLPKEYFGTFDMVLVHLSETVISFSRTEGLDMFGALSSLLNPEGVIVMNKLYLEDFSRLFGYTMQIHFHDVPVICSQALIYGSYGRDFFKVEPKDHGVDTIFSFFDQPSRFQEWHDYRKNNTSSQAHREAVQKQDELKPTEQTRSPGILMILEAEDAVAALSSKALDASMRTALTKEGFTVLDTVVYDHDDEASIVVKILAEGYVVARRWPKEKYCAFDIHLWSRFEKQEDLKKALLLAVGSPGEEKLSSSYRVVTGGMFGIETWKEDQEKRGPQRTQQCDERGEPPKRSSADANTIDTVLKESIALVGNVTEIVVAVVCGKRTESCDSLDTLAQIGTVGKVVPIYTCDIMEDTNEYMEDGLERMKECQAAISAQLEGEVADGKKIRVLLLDAKSSFAMSQIVHKICRTKTTFGKLFGNDITVLASIKQASEAWRRQFLERFRHDIIVQEPVFRAEVLFNSSDSSMEMGMLYSGDEDFVEHLYGTLERIESSTGLVSDVRNIQGGLFLFQFDFEPSQFVLPHEYDQTSPLEQYMSQSPLGLQIVVQLEMQNRNDEILVGDRVKVWDEDDGAWFEGTAEELNDSDDHDDHDDDKITIIFDDGGHDIIERDEVFKLSNADTGKAAIESLSRPMVGFAVKEALQGMGDAGLAGAKVHEFTNVGDGFVLVALWTDGSVVVLWDGKKHLDVNLFTYAGGEEIANLFIKHLNTNLPLLATVLRDEQPRGTGRVVNHMRDIDFDANSASRLTPTWAKSA